MTEPLSKAEVEELLALLRKAGVSVIRLDDAGCTLTALPALLTLARSAPSEELVKLGEAAVAESDAKKAYEGFDSAKRWCALDAAGDALFSAARAYARTVEKTSA